MKSVHIVLMSAIAGIVWMETVALIMGVNGIYLAAAMTAVGSIVGYAVKSSIDSREPPSGTDTV